MPFDAKDLIYRMLPKKVKGKGMPFNTEGLSIEAVQPGCWFYDREPVIIVRGPSACVSWLEPQVLQINYRIQIATLARTEMLHRELKVTCEEEKEIIEETLAQVKHPGKTKILVCSDEYSESVYQRAKGLVEAVPLPEMLFEVGFRSTSCLEQHRLALTAARQAGFSKTSNSQLAKELGMTAVGTMGHEHPQRFLNDYDAFTAMRDRTNKEPLFYLPDTYDAVKYGIPAAFQALVEEPGRDDVGIRFDSDDVREQYISTIKRFRELNTNNNLTLDLALESGWDLDKTLEFEALRQDLRWSAHHQYYGIGGYLVTPPWATFTRDTVQAVYKLSCTGGVPVMKFGGNIKDADGLTGKNSLPGNLMLFDSNKGRLIGLRDEQELLFDTGYRPVYRLSSSDVLNARMEIPNIELSEGVLNAIRKCKERVSPEYIAPEPKTTVYDPEYLI